MLPHKLSRLGENCSVSTIKSVFPYRFITKEHIFYEGAMPSLDYYTVISLDIYNSMSVYLWSFKDETISSLTNDLLSLHEVLIKANKQVFWGYNLDMTRSITISGLTVRLLL